MKDTKFIDLITKLDEKATEGDLNWESTAIDDEFQTTLATFIVRISHQVVREGYNDSDVYKLTIVNALSGKEIETITDDELRTALRFSPNPTGFQGTQIMLRIFKNAKRKALGVDRAVDDILSALDNKPPQNS